MDRRKKRRLERKVREAEKRINKKVKARMLEMMQDPKIMKEIDDEINAAGGARAFLDSERKAPESKQLSH